MLFGGILIFFLMIVPVLCAWVMGIGYLFKFFNKWGTAHEILWCTTDVISGSSCGWAMPLAFIIGLIGGLCVFGVYFLYDVHT